MPSILKDFQGPDWPLGFVEVTAPGTPVGIMTNVDSGGVNDPSVATSATSAEYTQRANQIIFWAFKPKLGGGAQVNTGNVYVVRKPASGAGGKGDTGVIVAILTPGMVWTLGTAAVNRNVFSPYRYLIDADVAGEGAFVTLDIG